MTRYTRTAACVAALLAAPLAAIGQTTGGQSPPVDAQPPVVTVQPQTQEQAPPGQPSQQPGVQQAPPLQAPAQPAQVQPAPVQPAPTQPSHAQTPQAQPAPDGGTAAILPAPPQGQWLASDYINTAVYGSSGEIVAYVSNLLLDSHGRVTAVIISYNTGFLGLGGKDIAVPFTALRIAVADGRALLRINASRADLDRAPAYVRVLP